MKTCLLLIFTISLIEGGQKETDWNFRLVDSIKSESIQEVVIFMNGYKTVLKEILNNTDFTENHQIQYGGRYTTEYRGNYRGSFAKDYEKDFATIENILQIISNNFPMRLITISDRLLKDVKLIKEPGFNPQSSLFVLIHLKIGENSFPLEVVNEFLTKLCENRWRPKYLMVTFRKVEATVYKQHLLELWSKRFLDATILEVTQPNEEKQTLKQVIQKRKEQTRIIHLNPFTNTLRINKRGTFFPEKLHDLHGYELKISFVNTPPEVYVNHSQQPLNISGLMYQKVSLLSNLMNFQIDIPNITTSGHFSCDKNNSIGQIRALRNGKIHLAASEFGRFANCENKFYEFSRGIGIFSLSLIVPILPEDSEASSIFEVLSVISILAIPLFFYLLFRILRFDKTVWRFEYILQMMIGFAVPAVPKRRLERIFFLFLTFSNFFFSSFIYTTMTSVYVKTNQKAQFNNIQDVLNSGITIKIDSLYYNLTFDGSIGIVRKLLMKADHSDRDIKTCLHHLRIFQNVTCIARKEKVLYILQNMTKRSQPVAKIIKEEISNGISNTVLEPGSPFVHRFDILIQRMLDTGIVKKWWDLYYYEDPREFDDSNTSIISGETSAKALKQVFLIFGVGFVISISVFILELFSDYLLKKTLISV